VNQPAVVSDDAATCTSNTPATSSVQHVAVSVAESHSRSSDTVAQSQMATSVKPGPHISDTAAEISDNSGELVSLTDSSPVINIADDDVDDADADVMVVDESEAAASKRMKETVVSAWQGQNCDALKSVVEKALVQVSASRGTDSASPNTARSNSVTVPSSSSHTEAIPAKPTTLQTTPSAYTGSHSQVTRPQTIGRGINTTATQSDVPTARVVGQIISMQRSSPQVTSTAHHRALTTVTHCTSVISSSTSPALTTVAVAPAVVGQIISMQRSSPQVTSTAQHRALTTVTHSTSVISSSASPALTTVAVAAATQSARVAPMAAQASCTNVSSAAKKRSSTSARPVSTVRRPGVRRAPRSRRVALLRPEDLYEISSQIVAEVLQRNRQPAESDVITCNDDDDDDDAVGTVVDTDISESHYQSSSSGDDVVVVDEPAVTNIQIQSSGTQHTRTLQTASAASNCARAVASSRKKLRIDPTLCESSSDVVVVDEPAVTSIQSSGTQHTRTIQAASADSNFASTVASSRKKLLIDPVSRESSSMVALSRKKLLIDPVSRESSSMVASSRKKLLIDPASRESGNMVASSQKKSLVPSSSRSLLKPSRRQCVGTSNLPDDVAVVDAVSHAADESDDVVCCDEDLEDVLERSAASLVPTTRTATTAADDDVLICDTPVPTENRALSTRMSKNSTNLDSVPVISAGSVTGCHTTQRRGGSAASATVTAASISATRRPHRDVSTADEVVLVEADNPSSGENTQGDVRRCFDSSVIILD